MNIMDALYAEALTHALAPDPNAYRAFARGDVVRLRRGSYVPTDLWVRLDSPARFRLAATVLAWMVPSTVFCGETSLLLRGLPVVKTPPTLDVAVQANSQLGIRPPSFDVHGAADLALHARALAPPPIRRHQHAALPVETVGQLACVPVAEALAEVLATAKFARALAAADGVLRLDPMTPLLHRTAFTDAVDALTFKAQRARARNRALLARVGAESPGESVSRALMLAWGFPEPALQVEYRDARGRIGFTDFTWSGRQAPPPGKDRLGEFDGWGKYFDSQLTRGEDAVSVIKREKKRENRLLALGHPVLRWTWSDLERPSLLRDSLLSFGLVPTRKCGFHP
jgi:hypothetical protein